MRLFRFAPIVLCILAISAPAMAEKLTVGRCVEMFGALSALDTFERDGKKIPYKLGMKTRIDIARNLTALRDIRDSYEKASSALFLEVTAGSGKLTDGSDETVRYNVENRKLLAVEQDVTIIKIKTADLNLDDNPISPMTLSLLQPMLDF